jgi:adenylate kinase
MTASCERAGCAAGSEGDVSHRIVFLGPPASGKGTAAAALSAALGVPHVSTGQMFREAIRKGGPLGEAAKQFIDKGQLVPDEITVQVVRMWLDEHGKHTGFIYDGFPRTLAQAEAFDRLLQERGMPVTAAILLDVSEAETVERVLGRLSCESCGALYHVRFVPPSRPSVCDQCGGKLIRRADDTEETVRKRLKVYNDLTLDVVKHYERAGVLRRVNGSMPKDRVFAAIVETLKS